MAVVGFNKKTVKDINLDGKRVLLRADYNVPIIDGKIADDYRMKQSVKTIEYILKHKGTRLVIISHLGRPAGPNDKDCSLEPVARHLEKLLGRKVFFSHDCIGDKAQAMAAHLPEHGILLMENLRYHEEEEKNDKDFAKALADTAQAKIFVQDGFGVVHRAHASTDAITKCLPSVAGLLLAQEVGSISQLVKDPAKPLVSIVGGAKVSDKIEVLNKLIEISDCVAVVGAMANNFLAAKKVKIGKSKFEKEAMDMTSDVLDKAEDEELKRSFSFLLPSDVVVSRKADGTAKNRVVDVFGENLADIIAYPKLPKAEAYTVAPEEMILDIGPASAAEIAGAIKMAKTVIWNGTCGVTEVKGIAGAHAPFAHGTRTIVDAMIGPSNKHANKPYSFVGGGDTVSYVEEQGLTEDFSFVSTGGGASLELISGHKLPGVEALEEKN
jgi:3-phosphoglycerate kinase